MISRCITAALNPLVELRLSSLNSIVISTSLGVSLALTPTEQTVAGGGGELALCSLHNTVSNIAPSIPKLLISGTVSE
jgi:hypothetical protein